VAQNSLTADAFILLVARHDRRLRGFVASLVAFDPEAIDEVVQTTCLVAWQKLASFQYAETTADNEFVRWLCTIARFEVLTYLRNRKKHTPPAFSEKLIDELATEQDRDSDYYEARRRVLTDCVVKLPHHQRETLRLRYGQGLSCKEVADRQGRSAGAVAALLARVRQTLEQCILTSLKREGYC